MGLKEDVSAILSDVRNDGKEAVKKYSRRFDNYSGEIEVQDYEWKEAKDIPAKDKDVIDKVISRVEEYHRKQKPESWYYKKDGSKYGLIYKSIQKVGLYVPGGKPLPSSLIMTGVPAKIADVPGVAICSPPTEGKINPYILYVAKCLGFEDIYKLGGIQAIGAMTYGVYMDEVDKIFGPGNKYVNEAKRQVYGEVGIDSLAGPSDICIICDETAKREAVLADLESQLEHGEGSKAWLLTTSKDILDYCDIEGVESYYFEKVESCADKANELAPEHLEIITRNDEKIMDLIVNAGAIYLGQYTPVPAGDYFLGVNHVLPTDRAARFDSVLTVDDFMKPISIADVSKDEYMSEISLGIRLAEIEEMELHKESMEVRKDAQKDGRS